MNVVFQFSLTIIIAIVGGMLGRIINLPAGMLLGSIVSVAVFQLFTGLAWTPGWIKIFSQGLIGTYIGTLVTEKDLQKLWHLWPITICLIFSLLGYNLITSFAMFFFTNTHLTTAICAMAPCSIADMAILCQELGGNTSVVVTVQILRLLFILAVTPFVAKKSIVHPQKINIEKKEGQLKQKNYKEICLILCFGIGAASIGYFLKAPVGCLSFSMIAVGGIQIVKGRSIDFPIALRRTAQCVSGMLVGSYMAYTELKEMKSILPQVFIILVGYVILNYFLAKMFSRNKKMTFATALFAIAPGGMSDMGLLAADFGGDLVIVAFLQQIRYIGVILLYPPVIRIMAIF